MHFLGPSVLHPLGQSPHFTPLSVGVHLRAGSHPPLFLEHDSTAARTSKSWSESLANKAKHYWGILLRIAVNMAVAHVLLCTRLRHIFGRRSFLSILSIAMHCEPFRVDRLFDAQQNHIPSAQALIFGIMPV